MHSMLLLWAMAAPQLLLNDGDIERLNALAASATWASTTRNNIIQAAKNWPAAHNSKYGVAEWSIPPEGGQWTHWYVCPVHGTGLQFRAPDKHVCTVDNREWQDGKFDQVVYMWRNSDNASAARDLALAYRFTREREYAEKAARILLAYAGVYGSWPVHDTNGRIDARSGGRLSSQTLDESVWLIPISWAYDLVRDSGVLSADERETIERDLLLSAVSVIQRNDAGKSNWQSWHNAAIGAVGFVTGTQSLIDAAIDGKSGFRYQMANSIFDDGLWYEGAWSYHFYALDPLWMLAEMAHRHGIDLYAEMPLRKMFEAPLFFALPDMTLPAFNDSGSVNVASQQRYYEIALARYADPLFASVLPKSGRSTREGFLWGVQSLPDAAAPERSSALFLSSGYAALRAPSSDHTVILDFGPHGGGHGHYDKLGFVSYARGGVLGVDPGTQPYAAPTHNTWDKMTVAHNTVVVDEQVQKEAEGKLLAFTSSGVMTAARAEAGPVHAGVSLARTMYVAPEYAVDVFDARATDGAEHTFDWVYHNAGRIEMPAGASAFSGFGKTNGYQHLTGTRSISTDGAWQVRFDATGNVEGSYGGTYTSLPGVKAAYTYSREQAASGNFSGKAVYDFTQARGYTLHTTPALTRQPDEAPLQLTLQVYGDGSGNKLSVRMNDSTDERFVASIGTIDWTGWREITVDAPETWTHYLGNNDGRFDAPVRTVSLEIAAQNGGSAAGALYVDDIVIGYRWGQIVAADFERPIRRLRLWMLGAEATTAAFGDGLGPDLRVPVPFAMARRRGTGTRFVALLEPYGNAPAVESFRMLENGRIEVVGAGYRDVFGLDESGVLFFERGK